MPTTLTPEDVQLLAEALSRPYPELLARIVAIETELQDHEKLLRGNGKPGLTASVGRIEPLVDDLVRTVRGSGSDRGLLGEVSNLQNTFEAKINALRAELQNKADDLLEKNQSIKAPLTWALTTAGAIIMSIVVTKLFGSP